MTLWFKGLKFLRTFFFQNQVKNKDKGYFVSNWNFYGSTFTVMVRQVHKDNIQPAVHINKQHYSIANLYIQQHTFINE